MSDISWLKRRYTESIQCGLVTLEWLLIVSVIAGIASASVLAVSRLIENSRDRPPNPETRVIDAEITAALIADDATRELDMMPLSTATLPASVLQGFERKCQDLGSQYEDVIEPTPTLMAPERTQKPPSSVPTQRAQCVLKRLP